MTINELISSPEAPFQGLQPFQATAATCCGATCIRLLCGVLPKQGGIWRRAVVCHTAELSCTTWHRAAGSAEKLVPNAHLVCACQRVGALPGTGTAGRQQP